MPGKEHLGEERIFSGRIRFANRATLIELTEDGQFLELGGPAIDGLVDDRLNYHRVSVLGRVGRRPLEFDSALGSTCLLASRLASHSDVELRAFFISLTAECGSPTENWLRAERELLGL
jgi:hypothetical protein